MRSIGILVLIVFIVGCSAGPSDPVEIAKKQVSAFLNAVKTKNQAGIKKLFLVTPEDLKHLEKFIEMFQGITITVKSAKVDKDNTIKAEVVLNDTFPGSLVFTKSSESPTAYKITALGGQHAPNGQKGLLHPLPEFALCVIGLLWCGIEWVRAIKKYGI